MDCTSILCSNAKAPVAQLVRASDQSSEGLGQTFQPPIFLNYQEGACASPKTLAGSHLSPSHSGWLYHAMSICSYSQ